MAPRRPSKKKGTSSKKRSSSRSKSKSRSKPKSKLATKSRASSKKKASKSKAPPSAPPWRRALGWMALEGSVIGVGLALGLVATGWVLWRRAESDVDLWMATPREPQTAEVLSAPMRLEVGQPATPDGLATDLLHAGYAQVEVVDEPDEFRVVRGDGGRATVEVWTGAGSSLHDLTEGRAELRLIDERIAWTSPDTVVLRPTVLARLGDLQAHRSPTELSKLSPWIEKAVLAMEDARFRDHVGVDPIGVARALAHNLTTGGRLHGGSTLTQQLAKNLFLSQERTARRKVREAFFATALENRLGKDRILELYLGEVYLGQVGGEPVHGVEQASRAWFGTSAAELDLAQAATLAGVISAPNAYSPVRHPERALERRALALKRMEDLGWADADAIARAKAQDLGVVPHTLRGDRRAPWTVDRAVEVAEDALGPGELVRGGYVVHTTVQPHLQRAAERAVKDGLAQVESEYPETTDAQAALLVVRASDGAVVAHVGGRDYATSPFDRASHAWRQAGSTVKPLTLLTALDHDPDLSPVSVVVDEPISRRIDGKPWTPRNSDGRHKGEITLRQAIEQSRNIPAIKLAEEVGPNRLQQATRDLGLSRATHLPSAALGAYEATALELATAYTVFPGGGEIVEPRIVTAITTPDGIPVLELGPRRRSLATNRAAAQTVRVLQGVITHGTLRRALAYDLDDQVGGKTGTTDDGRDAWVAGVTPGYSVVAWVGRDKGAPLGLGGSRAALPVWARMVSDGGLQGGTFPVPDGLEEVAFCRESGRRAREACPDAADELFPNGSAPSGRCDLHGGPAVKAVGFLGRLFRRNKAGEVEGEGAEAEIEAP